MPTTPINNDPVKSNTGKPARFENDNVSGTLNHLADLQGNLSALSVSTGEVHSDGVISADLVADKGATVQAITYWDSTTGRFVKGTEGALMGSYDTGWLDFDAYAGSYGLQSFTNQVSAPQFRIIGRTVYFRGMITVPLDNGAGSYYTNYQDTYSSTQVALQTTSTGWTQNTTQSIDTPILMQNSALYPSAAMVFRNREARRSIYPVSGTDQLILESNVIVNILANGKIRFNSIADLETPDPPFANTQVKHSLKRKNVTVVNANDYELGFGTVRTSGDGAGTFYDSNYSNGTHQYPFNWDGTDATYFGGMIVDITGTFYMISEATSLDTIHGFFS